MNSKALVSVVILAVIQDKASSKVELAAPYIRRNDFQDPPQFTIFWNTIDSGDKKEPVLGYKVHVWETTYVPRVTYKEIDGERVRIAESPRRRRLRLQKTRYTNSSSVVEGADTTQYTQGYIKINVTYEVKVQAFTMNTEGPLSPLTGSHCIEEGAHCTRIIHFENIVFVKTLIQS